MDFGEYPKQRRPCTSHEVQPEAEKQPQEI